MSGHAKLSPSAAERWMVCPGSVVLSEGMPQKSSPFADEGTRAHALAEKILGGVRATAEPGMLDNVMIYVDHIRGIVAEHPDAILMVEQRVKVNDVVYGTADAVIWIPSKALLIIVDLKYGAGVAVEVKTLQLKIYALAALLTFGYPAKTVASTIVQPRCPHADGPIRTAMYDVVELVDFHADIEDAVERVRDAQGMDFEVWPPEMLQPSEKGCRWCLAAPKCPKLRTKAQELAKQAFASGLPYDAKALSETLDFLPILEGWIKNTREFAYGEAEKGRDIPSYKLVEKRATRKWRDEASARAYFGNAPEFYTEPELKSPAQCEKLIEATEREKFEALVVKESSGHTLVHESDKRPAIKVDAASAFANT